MSHATRHALREITMSHDTLDALEDIARMMGGIDTLDLDIDDLDDAIDLDIGVC